jgi:hypothetical protein
MVSVTATDHPFIGIGVYPTLSLAEFAAILRDLADTCATLNGQRPLRFATRSTSGRALRERRISPDGVRDLTEEVRAGKLSHLSLHEHPGKTRDNGEPGVSLDLRLPNSMKDRTEGPRSQSHVLLPLGDWPSREIYIRCLVDIVRLTRPNYAFVYVGPTWLDVFEEVTAMPGTPWHGRITSAEQSRVDRLQKTWLERRSLGETVIRGAYWGTVIGREFVRRLGGSQQVRTTAPVSHIVDFPGDALYLQLTDLPQDALQPGYEERLAMLTEYLRSISLDEALPTTRSLNGD